jgi:hypothetical protein
MHSCSSWSVLQHNDYVSQTNLAKERNSSKMNSFSAISATAIAMIDWKPGVNTGKHNT